MFGSDRIQTNVVETLVILFTFGNGYMVNCVIHAMPYMELSRSPQVMRRAELPNADMSQRQTPNKEIVSRIELTYIRISRKYKSKGRLPYT